MKHSRVSKLSLANFRIYQDADKRRIPIQFDLEVTARCNLDCLHCYGNLPAKDKNAKREELSVEEIRTIAEEAVALGALHCTLTGGEPLLRPDFDDIYLSLKQLGLLVSVFTNATMVTRKQIELFKTYPPRNIEVSVYGVTQATYERVTRRRGSFAAFRRGLDLLLKNGIKVRLKAMALRSNLPELPAIARFCRQRTRDYFRFDPFLHLRFDGNEKRNKEIQAERLTADEIVTLERSDRERFQALEKGCDSLILPEGQSTDCDHIFYCSAGRFSFCVSYNGLFRLCSSLWQRDCVYDLRGGSLTDAWRRFVPLVLAMRSTRREFVERCQGCGLVNLCMWCPAHAHLETGELDLPVDYFCAVAHARTEMLGKKKKTIKPKRVPRLKK